jgi:signal transduction histidine kinase
MTGRPGARTAERTTGNGANYGGRGAEAGSRSPHGPPDDTGPDDTGPGDTGPGDTGPGAAGMGAAGMGAGGPARAAAAGAPPVDDPALVGAAAWTLDARGGGLRWRRGAGCPFGLGAGAAADGRAARTRLIHPADRKAAREALARLIDGRDDRSEADIRVRDAAGGWRWAMERRAVAARDARGAALRIEGLWVDVDDRKRAEAAAQTRCAQFEQGVAALPEAFILYDADDRIIMYNDRILQMHTCVADAFHVGAGFEDLVRLAVARGEFPNALGREEEWLAAVLAERRATGVNRIEQFSDGRWYHVMDRFTPDGGKVGLRVDVTALKQAELRALEAERVARAAREHLERSLDALTDGVVITDAEDRIVIANRAMRRIFPEVGAKFVPGASYADIIRHRVLNGYILQARGREQAWLDEYLARRAEDFTLDLEVQNSDGRWVHMIDRPTPDGGRVCLRLDISKLKAAETAIESALHRAEGAAEARRRFMAAVSHEMRTPLNGILGMAALIGARVEDPAVARMAGIVADSGRALLRMIEDVLDVSDILRGALALEAERLDPAALLDAVRAANAPAAARKGLALAAEGDEQGPARTGDRRRVLQILNLLVENAVKFTLEGEVAVTIANAAGQPLVATVTDTGVGFGDSLPADMCEPFVQAEGAETRRFGGVGIGLTIVRGLARMMDGAVSIAPRPGGGTVVRVSLPLAEAD